MQFLKSAHAKLAPRAAPVVELDRAAVSFDGESCEGCKAAELQLTERHPERQARVFRPGYRANLVASWQPALEGVIEKLERGTKIADIGCGAGASMIIIAEAFPNSCFIGFDYHDKSIERARQAAREAGATPNVSFEVATAKEVPGSDFDLVCLFDALHDMGDPAGAAQHVHDMLKADGTFMIVEPMAGDSLAETSTRSDACITQPRS